MRPDLAKILARPIAHRGLHDAGRGVIENSLAAAEAAIAGGFGIECDVQLSADGEAVVFHDEGLDRLTSETGPVSGRTAAELEAIGLKGGAGGKIPTLAAFLAFIAGRVPLVIEIKSLGDADFRLASRAVALAATFRGPLTLKSFDPVVMAQCRALGATCPLGLVGPEHPGGAPPQDHYDFLSWSIDELGAARAAHPAKPLMSWTVRTKDQHDLAANLGAQIVFEKYRPVG